MVNCVQKWHTFLQDGADELKSFRFALISVSVCFPLFIKIWRRESTKAGKMFDNFLDWFYL